MGFLADTKQRGQDLGQCMVNLKFTSEPTWCEQKNYYRVIK